MYSVFSTRGKLNRHGLTALTEIVHVPDEKKYNKDFHQRHLRELDIIFTKTPPPPASETIGIQRKNPGPYLQNSKRPHPYSSTYGTSFLPILTRRLPVRPSFSKNPSTQPKVAR